MLLLGNCNDHLKEIKDNSIDLILTDPPYGIEFMGKDWDKAVVPTETWKECYRILKHGKLAFVMCSPRQDVLSRMIVNLQDAGFRTNYTSIYWTFASGFPKAANISKLIDKKNGRYFDTSVKDYLNQKRKEKGLSFYDINKYLDAATNGGGIASALMGDKPNNELPTVANYNKLKTLLELDNRFDDLIEREEAEREIIGQSTNKIHLENLGNAGYKEKWNITKSATEAAKAMEGAYVGFQPKPAVEIILVVSKGKTLTWLDSVRIPYQSEDDKTYLGKMGGFATDKFFNYTNRTYYDSKPDEKGRFPANLLCQDDILNDGHNYKVGDIDQFRRTDNKIYGKSNKGERYTKTGDEGSYSRYFSLDQWWAKTFPFLIVPKASKQEKNNGCEDLPLHDFTDHDDPARRKSEYDKPIQPRQNHHPTVKPIKLMSYLITMGSREGDLVLDPFCGSGTTLLAAHQLHRKYLGIELNPEYAQIIKKRMLEVQAQLKLTIY
jgi:site-specific DNA-methyltransferase (adenine-specific)